MKIGLDIGSTTIKCVVLNDNDEILHKSYERHYSQITEKIRDILQYVRDNVVKGKTARLAISGSAGMGVAENCRLPFVQEVFATRVAANRLLPGSDVIIELGGEDAKILFLTGGMRLPKEKIHCSVLAEEAIQSAINDYRSKKGEAPLENNCDFCYKKCDNSDK